MTVDEVKNICKHFYPVRSFDGKVRCQHLAADHEMCTLPHYFRCELRIHQEREQLAKKGVQPYSISRLGCFDDCPRKYFLQYIAKAEAPTFAEAMELGKAFASCRANIDIGKPWEVNIPGATDYKVVQLRAVLTVYERNRDTLCPGEARQEVEGHWMVKDVLMRGFADRMRAGGAIIDEWKYSAMSQDHWNRMKVSRQGSAYFRAFPEATEFWLWLAMRSRHKPGKNETLDDFFKRLVDEEYVPCSKIFSYKVFKRDEFDLQTEDDWTSLLAHAVEDSKRTGLYPPRYSACSQGNFNCQWLPYCESHQRLGCGKPDCSHPSICGRVMPHIGL